MAKPELDWAWIYSDLRRIALFCERRRKKSWLGGFADKRELFKDIISPVAIAQIRRYFDEDF